MSIITSAVQYILDLGASAMLPIILTIFGLILGQGFVKSFRAGLTVGVGFIGINLVIGLISSYAGAAAQATPQIYQSHLPLLQDSLSQYFPLRFPYFFLLLLYIIKSSYFSSVSATWITTFTSSAFLLFVNPSSQ